MTSLSLFEPDNPEAAPADDAAAQKKKAVARKAQTARRLKKMQTLLTDPSTPAEHRLELLQQLARAEDPRAVPVLVSVLEAATEARGEDQYREKNEELGLLIEQMQQGPLRYALFHRMLATPDLGPRAEVILPDGTLASPLVPDPALAKTLQCGNTVWIDARGGTLVARAPESETVGDEATLEHRLPDGNIRARLGELGQAVYRVSGRLEAQLAAGEAAPGSTVVVCPRQRMAFVALPPPEGREHYRYLCEEPVPDVVLERDLGAPPAYVDRFLAHVRRELAAPEVARRHGVRRSRLTLLSGIPGSGKSYSIQALWNGMYREMSEAIGVPVDALPPRVMRLRSADVLSKWLGESDQQLARFVDEFGELAAETFTAPDGSVWELPVLVIAEEIDGLARGRGEDGVHDRILTTLLEGLDPGRSVFSDRLILFVATTNAAHLVDMAMIRRIGGQIERFDHMDRRDFTAVLARHVGSRPVQGASGEDDEGHRARLVDDVTSWLFDPNAGAPEPVELTYAGQANAKQRSLRDFMTAGLVDRAIQDAGEQAASREHAGDVEAGLDTAGVAAALHRQVRNIVDLLTPQNCGQYLSLPDGERVATLRRIDPPAALPFELMREPIALDTPSSEPAH